MRQRVNGRIIDRQRFIRRIALGLADDETAVGAHEKGVGHRAAGVDAQNLDWIVLDWIGVQFPRDPPLRFFVETSGRSTAVVAARFEKISATDMPEFFQM